MAWAGRLPHMMEGQPAHRGCAHAKGPAKAALEVSARVLLVWIAIALGVSAGAAQSDSTARAPACDTTQLAPKKSFLPLMAEEARKRCIEMPRPFGAGLVYYYLARDIAISDVSVGRNGAPPQSVSNFAQLAARAEVNNVNVKVDAWLLPFLNLYGIAGAVWNESQTTINVALPPLIPGNPPRQRTVDVPTSATGTVLGLGATLAGGWGHYFMTVDVNLIQADLGFDESLHGVITSIRAGWNGKAGVHPLRTWLVATDWNTFTQVTGTVPDPDGGTLKFVVDQGPAYRYTYGAGAQYGATPWLDLATDVGTDFHGGWYVALIPVVRW
jgi:hypothetical protein